MKHKWIIAFLALCMIVALLHCVGVGPYTSSSAVMDLKLELESIYGMEYTGKEVESGSEDMTFLITPKTWFLTNWNLRNMLGLDYQYECRVIFTTHTPTNTKIVRTITYQAADPMGTGSMEERAKLDLDSRMESTEVT